ncbi:hypothetical protein [Nonomuraea roseoviolacea]|uniref:hypothetical protein n=1 Tax=Nonomuraea roseoviolacea TaxID=103837 RepID=UPI0031CF680C
MRPRHHHGLPGPQVLDAGADGHDLGDAFVTDAERPAEGDVAVDRRDDRVGEAEAMPAWTARETGRRWILE